MLEIMEWLGQSWQRYFWTLVFIWVTALCIGHVVAQFKGDRT